MSMRYGQRVIPGIFSLGDDRYRVIVQWRYEETGRPQKRERVVQGFQEALNTQAAIKADPSGKRASARTVADYFKRWLKMKSAMLAPTTRTRYADALAAFAASFGEQRLDRVTHSNVLTWMGGMAGTYRPVTINGHLRIVKQCLDDAVHDGVITKNPAANIKYLPEDRTSRSGARSYDASQLRTFVAAADRLAAAGVLSDDVVRGVKLLCYTGMRMGELRALHWSDVRGDSIYITRGASRHEVRGTKTGRARTIPIIGPIKEILDDQREFLKDHPGASSGLVFPSSPTHARGAAHRKNEDEPTWLRSATTYADAVESIVDYSGLPRITPHGLRRSFEDLGRTAGLDAITRRSMAGWTTDRAQRIYATVSASEQKDALERMLEMLDNSPN